MESLKKLIERRGSDFWKMTVDSINEAVVIVTTDRRIAYLNRKAESLLSRRFEDVIGVPCTEAITCPNCESRCRLYEDGEVENHPVTILREGDSRPRTFLKTARTLKDEHGRVIGGVETLKDISIEVRERHEKERHIRMLAMEKERAATLLDSLNEGVFVVDQDLSVREWSTRMAEISGWNAEDVRGRHLFDVFQIACPVNVEGAPTSLDLADRSYRWDIRTKSGRQRPVDVAFRALRGSDGDLMGVTCDLLQFYEEMRAVESTYGFHGMIGRSKCIREVYRRIEIAADTDATVLITGESGTGKELVARAIHAMSPRRGSPYYAVNCATLTGGLLSSELFGHERGAFTGAFRQKQGRLESAGEGTLLLDEIGEMPMEHQAMLLRVLETREFERVGGTTPIRVRARLIASTNRDLAAAVANGTFRDDLHYRIKVFPIHVPPLRERREDIELLARYFLQRSGAAMQGRPKSFASETMDLLVRHAWPGNVRELKHLVEYLQLVAGSVIHPEDLPSEFRQDSPTTSNGAVRFEQDLFDIENEGLRVREALRRARGRRSEAAELLGIDRTTLWRKIHRLGIDPRG